jgi:hypothetical protein
MKYLFFDIECSVVSKTAAKICAFGYCLTDEQFHILEKEDILINPQGGFHLTDRKGTQGLVLPYEYGNFKKCPTFLEKAEQIYALLQDKDTLVAGHATMNDVKYLNFESKRFSLPSFCFDFALSQCKNVKIDTHRDNIPMQRALEKKGFSYCGIIHIANGDERIAYQKSVL